ncbi:MAG: hypothetical protein FD152_4022, partial [Xanthobacteraceae bacterium]
MVGVYNYMMIGLAITGLAALGIYMLSVTGDANLAARTARGAMAIRSGQYLTPFGAFLFASWFKFVVILAPLGVVMLLSFRADRLSAPAAQMTFWLYAALVGVYNYMMIGLAITGLAALGIYMLSVTGDANL